MTAPAAMVPAVAAILCCGCGAAAPGRTAAGPNEGKPAFVEFILSNLCSQDVGIADVTVETADFKLHKKFPQEKSAGGESAARGLQYGQEAYLADRRFPAGTTTVRVKLVLVFRGENPETLERGADMIFAAGPATVEISIAAGDDGCVLKIVTRPGGSSDEKCREPPAKAAQPDPPC